MKKTLNRLLSMVMCAMLLFGMLPAQALASVQIESDVLPALNIKQDADASEAPEATFAVRFLAFDGTELALLTVPGGGSVNQTDYPDAAREGYEFLGWHNGTEIVTALTDIQQDITLTAQYVQLFTITYENWDGTVLGTVPKVRAGSQFNAAQHYNGTLVNPTREGYGFLAWEPAQIESVSGDATITAVFKPLLQHTITINYRYENQRQAHDPYVATVYDGYPFKETIPSPEILGYSPDIPEVAIEGDIYEDQNVLVTYSSRTDTQYTIVHMLQNLNDNGYTIDETRIIPRTGRTGTLTTVTQADVSTYTGFTLATNIATCNDYIAADGSTRIELKYDRDIHMVVFDTADGTYIPPQVGRYGAPVTAVANPVRIGYDFLSWTPAVPTQISTADVTCVAKWKAKAVTYTVVFWRQNANDDNYSFAGTATATANAGTVVSAPGSALTDAVSRYFDYASCTTVTVAGNGATTQDVYYNRKPYTLKFKLDRNDAKIIVNGATYNGSSYGVDYSFTARYEEDITNRWPITVVKKNGASLGFKGWNGTDGSMMVSRRTTLTADLLDSSRNEGMTFTAKYNGIYQYSLVYMLQSAGSTGVQATYNNVTRYFEQAHQFDQSVNTDSTSWGSKDIAGFTKLTIDYGDWVYNVRTITFYYTRNTVSLIFHNGSEVSTTSGIFFGANIEDQRPPTVARPSGVDADAIFTGWYTEKTCDEKSLFNWTGATMPASGLILYAGWKKPTFTLTFDLNYEGGGIYATQTITKNMTATTLTAPTRDGYKFDYWYYEENGVQKIFTFSMGITGAMTLKAHWTAVAVTYTVRYVDANGNAVCDSNRNALPVKTAQGKVGALITEEAPQAFNSNGQPLFPDRASSSITLKASSAQNVITFVYTRVPTVYYLVRFVDSEGVERAPAKGPKATSDATVTESYINISGYSPNAYQITRNLAAETDPGNIVQNIITFVYTKNPTGTYIVKHYLQHVSDNGYSIDSGATQTYANVPLGATAYGVQNTYEGYSFVTGISTASGVVYSSTANPLTLQMYYNRNIVGYSASFVDVDTGETIAPDVTGRARFGKTVTVFASAIAGYQLDTTRSAAQADIPITVNAAANHVTFYYKVREGIAVTIRFLNEAGENIATPIVRTGETDHTVRLGRSYAYTLAAADTTRSFNDEVYNLLAGTALTQSLTIAQGDNFIDYVYAARKYTLTFDGNNAGGGSGIAPQQHRYRDVFALPTQQPVYGTYRFEGWSTDLNVRNKVYETQSDLQAVTLVGSTFSMPNEDVTLYAVWSHLEVSLAYQCAEAFTGSLPAGATVTVGGSVTVAGAGSMSRAGYTFAGWKRKDQQNRLINPPYGPDVAWEHAITLYENTTLYATWNPVGYTISYRNNLPVQAASRFTNPNTVSGYTVESDAITLQDASCYGYTFLGWYTDATLSTPATGIPTGSTGNRIFYARFAPAALSGLAVQGYTGVYDGQGHTAQIVDPNGQLLQSIDTVTYSPSGTFTNVTGGAIPVTLSVWRDGVSIWSGTSNVTITPKPITLMAADIDVVYSGQAYTLDVSIPTGADGAVTTADEIAIGNTLTYTVGGAAIANSFTNAMDATVVTVSAQHPNYTITPAYPTVAIAKRSVTVTADSLTATYDGQPHSVTGWVVAKATDTTGLVGADAVGTVSLSSNTRTDVGENQPMPYGATLSTGNAANYTFQYVAGRLVIQPSDQLTVNLTGGTFVYDGAAHGFAADAGSVPVSLEYRIPGGTWTALADGQALPTYTDAGTYTLTVRASNPNFSNHPTATATLTITPRDVTLRAGSLTEAYDGAAHTVSQWSTDAATATTGLVGGDAVQTVTFADNTRTEPGENTVRITPATWSAAANPNNYSVHTVDGLLAVTVNAGALKIDTDDLTVTYDGEGHRLLYAVTAPAGCPYDVYYQIDGGSWVKLAAGAMVPETVNVATHAYTFKVESAYYAGIGQDAATLTINRRPVTFIAGTSLGNVYTGSTFTVGYTVADATAATGLVLGDTENVALLGAAQTEAGTYAVTFDQSATQIGRAGQDVTANYAPTYTAGTLEIVKAASTTEDETAQAIYDAQPKAFTLPVLKDAEGQTLAGVSVAWSETPLAADATGWQTGELPAQTEVKAIGAGGQPEAYVLYVRLAHANYATQIAKTSLTVQPAPVTLTADRKPDCPYTLLTGGTPKQWRVTEAHWQTEGLAQDTLYVGDRIVYTLANNTQSTVSEGHAVTFASYAIENAAHAKNYSIATVDGFIRVVQGNAASTLTADGFTEMYDAQAHTLAQPQVSVAALDGGQVDRTTDYTFTYTVTHNGDSQTGSTLPAFTDAGDYSVRIQAASTLHATPEAVTVNVTILQRPLVLGSQIIAYPYDGLEHNAAIFAGANGYAPGTDHTVVQAALTLAPGGVNAATVAGVYDFAIDTGSVAVMSGSTDVTANYALQAVPGKLTITTTRVTAAQIAVADVDVVYDGQPHSIALPQSLNLSTQTIDLTDTNRFQYIYTTLDTQVTGAVETTVGDNPAYTGASAHRVSFTITDLTGSLVFDTVYASVTVRKRDVTITPASDTFVYDGAPHTVTGHDNPRASGDTGFIGEDYATLTLTGNTRTTAGTNDIGWVYPAALAQGDLANYNLLQGTGTITILKAEVLPLTLTANGGVYNAAVYPYAYTVGEPDTAALRLYYSTDNVTWTAFASVDQLPAHSDAGNYPLYLRAQSDNFTAQAETSAVLEITQRPVAVTPKDATYVYDGTQKEITEYSAERAGTNGDGTPAGTRGLIGTDAITVSLTNNGRVEAGESTVGCESAQPVGATRIDNYAFDYRTGTLTVTHRTGLSATLTADDAVYDGLAHRFTFATNAIGPSAFYYSVDGSAEVPFATADELPSLTDAGSITLTVRVVNPNYSSEAGATQSLTVTPAPLTLRVLDAAYAFDGQPRSLTAVAQGLVGGDTLSAYTLSPASATAAGIYPVAVEQASVQITHETRGGNLRQNYEIAYVPGTLTIADFTLQGYEGIYDGQPHGATLTVPDAFAADYTVTFEADGLPAETAPSFVDAGTYAVTVTLTPMDAASGLPVLVKTVDVAIAEKPITLLASDIVKVYNGEYSHIDVSLPGGAAVNSTDAALILANVTYTAGGSTVENSFVNAGTQTVTVASTAKNYIITPVDAQVAIAQRPVTVTAGTAGRPYNELPLTVGYTVENAPYNGAGLTGDTGLLREHTLTAVLQNETRTDVCDNAPVTFDRAATQIDGASASVLANYAVQYVDGAITITKAQSLTLTLKGYNAVYDAQAHGVAIVSVLDGARSVSPDRFQWYYGQSADRTAADANSHTDVCDVLVYVTGISTDGNYPDISGVAQLRITPRPVLVTPATAEYTYDGLPHTVADYNVERAAQNDDGTLANGRGLLGSDALSVTLTNASHTQPGVYDILWESPVMATGLLGNYALAAGAGQLRILPASQGLSIQLEGDSLVYDAQAHRLTYTVTAPDGCPYVVAYALGNSQTFTLVGADGLLPAMTAAGDYPVRVRVTSDYYVTGYAQYAQATLSILKRPLTITSETNTFVYDKQQHTVSGLYAITPTTAAAGLVSGGGVSHAIASFGYEPGMGNAQTAVGGHEVRLKESLLVIRDQIDADVTANYDVAIESGAIEVTAQAASAQPATRTVQYNGQTQAFALPVLLDADGVAVTEPITYEYSVNGGAYSATAPGYADVLAGGYTVDVRMTSANYQPAETTSTLLITPAPITVKADSKDDFLYTIGSDGNAIVWQVDTASLTAGELYLGAMLAYSLAGNTRSDIGQQDVTVAACAVMLGGVDVSHNYSIQTAQGSLTVNVGTAEAQLTTQNIGGQYNGQPYTLPQPIVSVKAADGTYVDQTDDYRIKYVAVRERDGQTTTFTNELPHFVDVGVYNVTVTATSRRQASPQPGSATITITARPLVVAGGNNAAAPFAYNGEAQQVDPWQVLTSTFAPGDDIVAYTFAEDQSNEATDACDRPVTLTGVTLQNGTRDVSVNYAVTYEPGRIVILPLPVEGALALTGVSRVYNGGASGIDVGDTLSTALGNYSLSGSTLPGGGARFTVAYAATPEGGVQGAMQATNPQFTDVTLQTVTVYVTDLSGNLLIAPASETVEIQKRDVTITPASDTVPYDGAGHTITAYQRPKATMGENGIALGDTGLVGEDDVTVQLIGNGPHTAPGAYPVTWGAPVAMTHGKSSNYTFLHGEGLLTITQATGIDLRLSADSTVYDGLAHGYTATALVPEGCPATLEYLNESGQWITVAAETPLPEYVNAGSYPLTVRVSSPYYTDTMARAATLTIAQRPLTITSGNNADAPFTYNRNAQQVAAALVQSGELAVGQRLNLTSVVFEPGLGNENTDVCDRDVLVSAIRVLDAASRDVTDNYAIDYTAGRIVIQPAQAQALPTVASVPYDGQPHAFTAPTFTDTLGVGIQGASYAYSLSELAAGDQGWISVDAMPTRTAVARDTVGNLTQYLIYVRVSQGNYLPVVTTAMLTITPAPITVTADTDDSFVYTLDGTGAPVTWYVNTATVSGTRYNGETAVYTLSQNGQAAIGGHAVYVDTVRLMFGETDYTANYAITRLPGHIAVSRGVAASTIAAGGSDTVYDAQAHRIQPPAVLVTDVNGNSLIRTEDYTLTYTVTRAGTTESWAFDDLADMALTEAGIYSVTIHAESTLHANPADKTVTLTIDRRPLTITSESNSEASGGTPFTYNGEEQHVRGDASAANIVSGHTLANLAYAAGKDNTNVDVCDRDVLLESVQVMDGATDVTGNYAIAYRPGRIVIKPLAITAAQLVLTGVDTEYDGLGHSIGVGQTIQTEIGTLTVTDVFDIAYVSGGNQGTAGTDMQTATNPEFFDVGVYPIVVTLTARNGNFTVAPATATVSITPRPLAVRYSALSEAYNGQAYTVPRQIDGLTRRDAIHLTESNRTAVNVTRLPDGSLSALPTTALSLTLTDAADEAIDRSGNYTVTVVPGSIEILPIPLLVTVESQTFQYDAAAHTVTDAQGKGLLENHALAVTLGGNTATNVVDRQPMALRTATVTDTLTGEDVTDNYTITSDIGTLSVTPAPLTLKVTSITLVYDGLYHRPDVYASAGLMGADELAAYTLLNMPQRDVGRYSNVTVDTGSILLTNGAGEDVTGNYTITITKGRLVIQPQTATYTVRYYYDGVLDNDATATLSGVLGSSVSTYPTRRLNGYTLSRVAYLPLKLTRNADDNVIRVYYVSITNLITLDDLGIPLGAGGLNYEVGLAVE